MLVNRLTTMLQPDVPTKIPSLDGLRAVSILAVLAGHVVVTYNFPYSFGQFHHLGNIGVRCFFIISGFLITTLLFREFDRHGQISIARFYARRSLRILPAFLVFIFAIYLAQQFGWIKLNDGDLLHALTFTMNYHHDRTWYLNHLWSLSVEEQFYLLWPGLIMLFGPKKSGSFAILAVLFAPVCRWYMWHHGTGASAMTREFQAVADALATGCLLAIYYNVLTRMPFYMRLLASSYFPVLPLAGLLISVAFGTSAYYVWGQSLANISIALAIDWTIRRPTTNIGRLLNSKPFVWIGMLSYSLYLWQEPFLNPDINVWVTAYPQNLALTLITATISYWLVERRFLRLKPQ